MLKHKIRKIVRGPQIDFGNLEDTPSVTIRKDFPDTWIWKEINEEG